MGRVLSPTLSGRHANSAPTTPMLLKPFTQNGAERPRLAATTPPSAGPIARLMLIPMLLAAIAAGRSALGTSWGTTTSHAGQVNATAVLLSAVNRSRLNGVAR